MQLRSIVMVCVAAAALTGFDWPGRARALSARLDTLTAQQRRAALRELSDTRDPEARALVQRLLDDAAVPVRLEAAERVASGRITEAAPVLLRWLDDPDATVRLAATRALGALRVASTLASLTRMLSDADVTVRSEAVRAVASVGRSEAVVALLDRVSDAELSVRVEAARTLGAIGDARAVFTLLGALQDSAPEVRGAAVEALGRLRDARSLRGLIGLLHDPVIEVRIAAVRAVGALGASAPEAVPALAVVALRESREWDPPAQSRLAGEAVAVLAAVATPAAIDVLVEVIRRGTSAADRTPVRESFRALRAMGDTLRPRVASLVAATPQEFSADLAGLLGGVGGDDAARAILAMLERSADARTPRELFIGWLGLTGSPLAVLPLFEEAERDSPRRREVGRCPRPGVNLAAVHALHGLAARAGSLGPDALDLASALLQRVPEGCDEARSLVIGLMGATGNSRAPATLLRVLPSGVSAVRLAVARALHAAGSDGAESALAEMLSDASPDVRRVAADALVRHGGEVALAAVLRRWRSDEPLDRTSAARAMGRILRRVRNGLAADALDALRGCARSESDALSAACFDGLVDLAATGDPHAIDALFEALGDPRAERWLPAAEALANVVALSPEASRAALLARFDRAPASRARDPRALAMRAWARTDTDELIEALRHAPREVAINALAAWGRDRPEGALPDEVTAALEGCVHDRGGALAINARLARAAPVRDAARGAVDARVMSEGREAVALREHALVLPGGWIRVGVTGPDGWIHVRDVGAGSFRVIEASRLGD